MPKIKFPSADLLFGTIFNHVMTFYFPKDFCLVQRVGQSSLGNVRVAREILSGAG